MDGKAGNFIRMLKQLTKIDPLEYGLMLESTLDEKQLESLTKYMAALKLHQTDNLGVILGDANRAIRDAINYQTVQAKSATGDNSAAIQTYRNLLSDDNAPPIKIGYLSAFPQWLYGAAKAREDAKKRFGDN